MVQEVKRTLDSETQAEVALTHTRPVCLVKILFEAATIYLSSGPDITYDGNLYLADKVTVGPFRSSPDGGQEGNIEIYNENDFAISLVLTNNITDVVVEIYTTYLKAGGGNTPPVFFISGSLQEPSITPSKVSVNVVSFGLHSQFLPVRYHTYADGFHFLPANGQVVTWNNERFMLEEEGL